MFKYLFPCWQPDSVRLVRGVFLLDPRGELWIMWFWGHLTDHRLNVGVVHHWYVQWKLQQREFYFVFSCIPFWMQDQQLIDFYYTCNGGKTLYCVIMLHHKKHVLYIINHNLCAAGNIYFLLSKVNRYSCFNCGRLNCNWSCLVHTLRIFLYLSHCIWILQYCMTFFPHDLSNCIFIIKKHNFY